MTTIGYIFLNKDRSGLVSLAEQREAIEAYAGGMGGSCHEWLVEAGYEPTVPVMERTEGEKLLTHTSPGDTILVMRAKWMLSSARSAVDLLGRLKEKGVSLYCLDLAGDLSLPAERKLLVSQGIAHLVQQLCGILAQGESEGHGVAIRTAKARQKEAGKYMGGPVPFGWCVGEDGRMQKNSEEQAIIEEMVQLKEGKCSYRNIAGKVLEKYEVKFSHEGIRRILLKYKKRQS